MKYCRKCILPDTRPGLTIGPDGVCSACEGHREKREEIDWVSRRRAFEDVVDYARQRSRGYDCIVPVSGGKDSTWQVVKCLEYGLNPLAVTWKTPARTALGARNLANLVSLGVDHIDYQVNPKVERRFMVRALDRFGSTAVPMHLALFSIPLTVAVRFQIPLVVWGENSALEYGGTADERRGFRLDAQWLKKYGVTHGTTAEDWIADGFTAKELTPYFGPTDAELEAKGALAVFLGHYFPWDPATSLEVARRNGFLARDEGPKTGLYNYADIDDDFISIHHYLKWYKFGFTRTWDNLALEIRNGRMSRDEAIRILSRRGDETPHESIDRFCVFAGISRQHFFDLAEKWRNPAVWTCRQGKWVIEDFLVPNWRWDEVPSKRPAA